MSTPTYGQPSIIDQAPMPPAAVNIASSTNGADTVITTSTAHGLQTGMAVIINGHTVNTNADGIWIATVLTSTTFKISTFAGFPSTFIAGNGVGGATGTVQSLAFPGVNLPQDAVDDCDASSVNVPFEFSIDALAWLAYTVLANQTILPGGSWTASLGTTWTLDGTGNVAGSMSFGAASRLTQANQSRLNMPPKRLSDADHTVNCGSDGPIIILEKPTATRTITIQQASDSSKENGDTLEFYMPIPGDDPATDYYRIKREGSANYIATLWGKYLPSAGAGDTYPGFCRIHLEGGVWRLTGGAGVNWDTDA